MKSEKYNLDKYKYVRYSKQYPRMYENERGVLLGNLPHGARIEHVGSTSVPGLGGKGIIDIAVFHPKNQFEVYQTGIQLAGYEYRPRPGDEKRKFYQKVVVEGGKERRKHVHLTSDEDFWNSFIAFRDYLRTHKNVRDEYARIKREGAKLSGGDGVKYAEYKIEFLQNTARKAFAARKK